jgi:hypothetical protein
MAALINGRCDRPEQTYPDNRPRAGITADGRLHTFTEGNFGSDWEKL